MCVTCGCGGDDHRHSNEMSHEEMHIRGVVHHHEPVEQKKIDIERDILCENQSMAERNRGYFEARNIYCVNLVSSPGSGKTTLLEETLHRLLPTVSATVIEGDQQTSNDAERIRATGARSRQINTQNGCHLDAGMINRVLKDLDPNTGSILFIENVGNLVCPAMFDLGEQDRIVVISVTEGDDKPLKYPYIFESASICIINKIDLLPHLRSDVATLKRNALQVNPALRFFELSAVTGENMEQWCDFLREQVKR